jgi:hypothetical protein
LIQKVPKKSSQQQGFFAARGLCPANPAKPGCNYFARRRSRNLRFSKILLCLPTRRPALFCRISPEAAPLTKKNRQKNRTLLAVGCYCLSTV